MPSTIPYHPSLVLGNIVDKDALAKLESISAALAEPDAAEMTLNSLIASRRSLDLTKTELENLELPEDQIQNITNEIDGINKEIGAAALNFAQAKIAAEKKIRDDKSSMKTVASSQESPIDYVKSSIKTLPLASDSVNMNVQYFSFDENKESATSYSAKISAFVSKQTKFLGQTQQAQVAGAANKQAASQAQNKALRGTLVLSVSCTHKNASVFAPFILNVDKGVRVWNSTFPDNKLDPSKPQDIIKTAKEGTAANDKISLISGTTFGSTFVGMVHILKESSTQATESLASAAVSLQQQMEAGSWFASQSGGFGVEASFASNVKSLLSSQSVSSHVTMVCMGVIPSIVANDVQLGVKEFAKFDPQSSMEAVAAVQNATNADNDSIKASAEGARTGAKMISMKQGEIKAALSALAEIDDGNNKILDVNSMMTAFDDYLKKAAEGNCGVPINYYLKDIDRLMLAEMWVAKYYPGRFLPIISDDSERPPNPAAGSGSGGQPPSS